MGTTVRWLESFLARLPLTQPGTLVASEHGVGVFMGNWGGGERVYGVKRGGRIILELYPTGEKGWAGLRD
ncbi:MAG TPA: hypothetical protein VFG19_01315 [Geobacteraceae bacterium]|nr:hypothetical protein [Geobacteraceae bacterium]